MNDALKLFKIQRLFGQLDVALPLDEKVNIFLGENGMGKTTVLNCLYYALSGNLERLNSIIFIRVQPYPIYHSERRGRPRQ